MGLCRLESWNLTDILRPSLCTHSQYFNKWLSLLGCLLSVAAMFLCSWPTALITFGAVVALFTVVLYRKPRKFGIGQQ